MANSPLSILRFRLVFLTCWFLCFVWHAYVLKLFGFPWPIAVTDSFLSNALLMGSCVLVTTILRYYIPQTQRYSFILGLCLVLSIIWLFCSRMILLTVLGPTEKYDHFFFLSIPVRMAIGFLLIGCMALISILWYLLQEQHLIEKRKSEADKLSREAELYKLRQQLQPHFLFNSLNSINALIGSQPKLARNMIQQLSDFLRGILKKEENQWVSLEEELNHLQLYLEIEKVRFGHRLITSIINKTDFNTFLPPMLLQPVVENAIKFGLYDTTGEISISIKAYTIENYLEVVVQNPFDPLTSVRTGTGFGLKSIQRRLYLLFSRNDLLTICKSGNVFFTSIKIPQYDQSNNN